MNARQESVTVPQMNYIDDLVRKLRGVLEEGDDIADQLDAAAHASLSKRQASDLIEALIGSLERLGVRNPRSKDANVVPMERRERARQPSEIAAAQRRQIAEERRRAYDAEQLRQFSGERERNAPAGRGRYLTVWKRQPNRAAPDHFWDPIDYGWAWQCTHPDHGTKANGGPRIVTGGSHLGFAVTIENAGRHWSKYHKEAR